MLSIHTTTTKIGQDTPAWAIQVFNFTIAQNNPDLAQTNYSSLVEIFTHSVGNKMQIL